MQQPRTAGRWTAQMPAHVVRFTVRKSDAKSTMTDETRELPCSVQVMCAINTGLITV
jgi:hypothetical protein